MKIASITFNDGAYADTAKDVLKRFSQDVQFSADGCSAGYAGRIKDNDEADLKLFTSNTNEQINPHATTLILNIK